MRYIKHIIVVLAAFSLSGCYTSDAQLVTPANADYPIAKTSLTWTDYADDKMVKPNPDHSTSLLKDGYYEFTDSQKKTTPVLFKKIGGNFYILEEMVPSKPGDTVLHPIYALTRIEGGNIYTYNPMCSPDIAAKFKTSLARTEGDAKMPSCYVKDVAGLTTIFQSLETTKPFQRSSFQ